MRIVKKYLTALKRQEKNKKTEIKKIIPFTNVTESIKYMGINLTKNVKNF